eukprot:scaffold410097_cov22-Prasinocladus_malaysianus.AAC.1
MTKLEASESERDDALRNLEVAHQQLAEVKANAAKLEADRDATAGRLTLAQQELNSLNQQLGSERNAAMEAQAAEDAKSADAISSLQTSLA